MPMIARVFLFLQTLSSTALILLFFCLASENLLILVLILSEEIRRSWLLIPDMPHLFLCDISFFFILEPITRIGLFILGLVVWCQPCHIDTERKIQLPPRRPVATLYHIHTQERLGIDLHSSLAQDQSALLDSRLDLPMEFLAVAYAVGERIMPLAI
jgi:hypothetical protein